MNLIPKDGNNTKNITMICHHLMMLIDMLCLLSIPFVAPVAVVFLINYANNTTTTNSTKTKEHDDLDDPI